MTANQTVQHEHAADLAQLVEFQFFDAASLFQPLQVENYKQRVASSKRPESLQSSDLSQKTALYGLSQGKLGNRSSFEKVSQFSLFIRNLEYKTANHFRFQ